MLEWKREKRKNLWEMFLLSKRSLLYICLKRNRYTDLACQRQRFSFVILFQCSLFWSQLCRQTILTIDADAII